MYDDPDYHQNLTVSPSAHVPTPHVSTLHRILRKSVQYFLHNPANKQTNADENITSSVKVTSADFAEMN